MGQLRGETLLLWKGEGWGILLGLERKQLIYYGVLSRAWAPSNSSAGIMQ